jgi:hypothetical protein
MEGQELTLAERLALRPGEAITLAAVMAILVVSIATVVIYRMFKSSTGSAKLPGGWQFTWK